MKLYSNVTIIFLIWLITIVFVTYFGFLYFPHAPKFNPDYILSFANWDGGHYLQIAEFGYRDKNQYAFFPLYPLVIRFINQILQNYTFSLFFVSIVSSLFAVNLFYKLVLMDFSKEIAKKAVLMLLIFPTSFYLITGYSEGLFLLLVISAFYFLKQDRLLLATICCVLVSATRLAGLAVVCGFLVEVIITRGINKKNFFVLFAPLGFILYSLYLFAQTSDPFYFITAETSWLRFLTFPGNAVWETIRGFSRNGLSSDNIKVFIDLIFTVFGIGMVIRSFRFLNPSFVIYGLISLILPLFTTSLISMPRFLLPIFPIFILMAIVKNENILFLYQLISPMFLAVFSVLFVNSFWVS